MDCRRIFVVVDLGCGADGKGFFFSSFVCPSHQYFIETNRTKSFPSFKENATPAAGCFPMNGISFVCSVSLMGWPQWNK